jgi:uncharacterized membrane protein
MAMLIAGLVLFLGAHSVRIFADDWRNALISKLGTGPWKGLYSLVSLAGFVLIVTGSGAARATPVDLWMPPRWTAHPTSLLTLIAFILLAAAYVKGNHIKAAIGHPMVAGVKIWAFAHLLSNGRLADVILFGAFLVWAVLDFRSSRQRDKRSGTRYPAGSGAKTAITVVAGVIAWAVFAFVLHAMWIGVKPLG